MSGLARALAAVHAVGVAHRDVKPSNVLLAPRNRVVLTDFGISLPEYAGDDETKGAGTPDYMAPETILEDGHAGNRFLGDLYALGIIGFELLTGTVPFEGETLMAIYSGHLAGQIPDVAALCPEVPSQLADLIGDLLAKSPTDRPESARSVEVRLRSMQHAPSPADRARPFSILVVDDDVDHTDLVRIILREELPEAIVTTMHDPPRALEAVRTSSPDLILLDLNMPGMNGIEVCMYLRGMHLADEASIVSVSSNASVADILLLRHLGIAHHIDKTNLSTRLRPLLRKLSRRRSQT
ncbi:MAG: hypothetical protein NVS3B20_02640 [Polyangiales bacterium]